MRYMTIGLCICLYSSIGIAEIFKCNVNGKTIFTDQACDGGEEILLQATNSVKNEQAADFFYDTSFYSDSQWFYGASGYNKAKQLAVNYQAPMLVYFYTDWCGYCKAVDTNLLPQTKAIEAMKPFVKVRVNPEQGDAEDKLFKSMNGKGYPRLLAIPYEKSWQRISVTPDKDEQNPVKHVSVNEFVESLTPFQPPPPLPSANDHYQRAKLMLSEGNRKQAIKDTKISISRDPYQFDYYKLLDDILVTQRDFKQIISYWDKFIRLSPKHDQAFLERAGAHHHNKNPDAANADWKRAAELGNQEAVQYLQKLP